MERERLSEVVEKDEFVWWKNETWTLSLFLAVFCFSKNQNQNIGIGNHFLTTT